MPYVLGLIALAILATYPLGRWQRRRLRDRTVETNPLQGAPDRSQFEASSAAQEAVIRSSFSGGTIGGP